MSNGMDRIKHLVVMMFENRSFDNLAGWLYTPDDPPSRVVGGNGSQPFHGLAWGEHSNPWDVDDPSQGTSPVVRGTTQWGKVEPYRVPDPDPEESFANMTFQLFGANRSPQPGDVAAMTGFLQDYAKKTGKDKAPQVLECYSPEQVPVLSGLARSFALSDLWFASVPAQTTPNRGFVHTGSSDGHVNNGLYYFYDIRTIFNVLAEQGVPWGVYNDSRLFPALSYSHFPKVWKYRDHFHHLDDFENACAGTGGARLPAYTFVEPRFKPEPSLDPPAIEQPNDYHPPWNVCRGEQLLARVYEAVRTSPYRDDILFVVTFDEHGGCYDHVPPPWGAVAPEPGAVSPKTGFRFDRFGGRVVTILASSYVEPGTIFRSPTETPYDHTSILATLRDWQGLDGHPEHPFLPSPRIAAAPTFGNVLTLAAGEERDWPAIPSTCQPDASDTSTDMPINDLQLAHAVLHLSQERGEHLGRATVEKLQRQVKTVGDLVELQRKGPAAVG